MGCASVDPDMRREMNAFWEQEFHCIDGLGTILYLTSYYSIKCYIYPGSVSPSGPSGSHKSAKCLDEMQIKC